MPQIVLLTKKEANFLRLLSPYDDQVVMVEKQKHFSYKIDKKRLEKLRAATGRPKGKLVKSSKYGDRRAYPADPKKLIDAGDKKTVGDTIEGIDWFTIFGNDTLANDAEYTRNMISGNSFTNHNSLERVKTRLEEWKASPFFLDGIGRSRQNLTKKVKGEKLIDLEKEKKKREERFDPFIEEVVENYKELLKHYEEYADIRKDFFLSNTENKNRPELKKVQKRRKELMDTLEKRATRIEGIITEQITKHEYDERERHKFQSLKVLKKFLRQKRDETKNVKEIQLIEGILEKKLDAPGLDREIMKYFKLYKPAGSK